MPKTRDHQVAAAVFTLDAAIPVIHHDHLPNQVTLSAGGRGGHECHGSERDKNRMKSHCQVQDRHIYHSVMTCVSRCDHLLAHSMWGPAMGHGYLSLTPYATQEPTVLL